MGKSKQFKRGDRVVAGNDWIGTVAKGTEKGSHPAFDNAQVVFDLRPRHAVHVHRSALRLATPEDEQNLKATTNEGENMPYYYSQGERVHVGKGQLRGTVTEDQKHDSNLVKVARDDKPEGSVDGYYAHDLKPLTTEENYFETMDKVRVQWDKRHASREEARELTPLHTPRATDPVNPHQAEIDAIDAIRLPLIAELEMRQAVLSKLTAAKKILQKNG